MSVTSKPRLHSAVAQHLYSTDHSVAHTLLSNPAALQGRRKTTSAVEIFGFLFDAEGFAAASTALDSTTKGSPLTSIPVNIPKGESKKLTFTVAVQARSPRPFRFAGFKGSYRNAGIEKTFNTFDPCEIDSSKCADGEDQPENAAAGFQGSGFRYDKK